MKPVKMKILFFIDCLNSGGKERRLTELMKALIKKPNIEFELVVMSNEIYYKEILEMPINIHYLIRKTKKDFSVFKKFYYICKKYKPDIVHCWDSMTAVYSIPACKLLDIKLINGLVVDSPLKRNILNKHWLRAKLTFPFSNLVIGNSKAGLSAYNVPTKKSYLIYNGFNFKRTLNLKDKNVTRTELNINTPFVIGMVATFWKFKDYKTYFSAAQLLLSKRRDITFLAVGSNTDSKLAINLIDDCYKENFRFLGKRSDIESVINCMDICVLSTFTEGISNSILEYMALKKPVIATDGGGTNEIVKNWETGLLIGQSNPVELLEKIEILLNDNGLSNKIALNAHYKVQSSFSMDLMTKKFISAYNFILT